VVPGGHQTLTVTTDAGLTVAYDTQYADGKDGRSEGGSGTGKAGADGRYTTTWVVSPSAAHGQAVVYIAISGGQKSAFRQPTFTVAPSC
jgi:hypothetical protein